MAKQLMNAAWRYQHRDKYYEHEPWRSGWQERHVGMALSEHQRSILIAAPQHYQSIPEAQHTEAICA